MEFSGRNLQMVRDALNDAIAHLNTEIGLHPEPNKYPDDIDMFEGKIEQYEALLVRVKSALYREEQRQRRTDAIEA
jgi:hypothetical protein